MIKILLVVARATHVFMLWAGPLSGILLADLVAVIVQNVTHMAVLGHPKFKSEEVAKFINVLMTRGKKSVAERIMYGALDQIAKKSGKDPFEVVAYARAWRQTCRWPPQSSRPSE